MLLNAGHKDEWLVQCNGSHILNLDIKENGALSESIKCVQVIFGLTTSKERLQFGFLASIIILVSHYATALPFLSDISILKVSWWCGVRKE